MRAMFRVVEIHKFGGRRSNQRLVRMQYTQVTSEIFAGQFDLIVPSPEALMRLDVDSEVMIEVTPLREEIAKTAAPPLR